jgi:hypothetical protein
LLEVFMTTIDVRPAAADESILSETIVSYVQWGAIVAGAIAAAALAFVLHGFAAAIGLAVSSSAPTWRDASMALVALSGFYLILAALASYGLGGYVAGRMRSRPITPASVDEVELRDGGHGLLTWALATLMTGVLLLWAAQAATRLAAPPAGTTGPASSVAGENVIAYDLDRLFRAERRPADGDLTYARAEAGRILLTASSHRGVAAEDRTYLTRLVSARTGLDATAAEQRVNDTITRAHDNIARARRSATLVGFMAAAAALLGAAVAWFAACAGGRHRDGESVPSLPSWSLTSQRSRVRTLT